MIVLALNLILAASNATASNCQAEDLLYLDGQCYQKTSPIDCSIDPKNNVEINNGCYKPEVAPKIECNDEFNLSVNEFCLDTSAFSDSQQLELFNNDKKYSIQVRLIPKQIQMDLKNEANTSNWYLDRVFETYTYEDQIDPNEDFNYSFSAPIALEDSQFDRYDQKIVPEIFSSIHQNIEMKKSIHFKINPESEGLINNSKLNVARALESIFSKYGQELQDHNLYIGVRSTDPDGNNLTSFAGIGLPTQNGDIEIKIFSSEKPKNDLDKTLTNTLESETGFEVGLLNINSGSYVIDIYGSVHNIEQSLLNKENPTEAELEEIKGWVLGTRIKPNKNLDLSVELGENKSRKEANEKTLDETSDPKKDKEVDLQFKLSISYVFSI